MSITAFLGVIALLAFIAIVRKLKEWWDSKEDEREIEAILQRNETNKSKPTNMDTMNETNTFEQPATRDLVKEVLKKMGCPYEDKENEPLTFGYQGITFVMEVVNDCLFVNLIWPWCHSFNIFDIDEYARVRKVINQINSRSSCTIIYTPNPESDEVAVHIRKNFIVVPQIPQLDNYLHSILSSFFAAARELSVQIEKVRMQECENQ